MAFTVQDSDLVHGLGRFPFCKDSAAGMLAVGCRFGIGIFYTMLYQLLRVAFAGPEWLVQASLAQQLPLTVCRLAGACANMAANLPTQAG